MAVGMFDRARSGRRITGLRLLVLICLLPVGCSFPGQPNPANRPIPADQIVDFKVLYGQNCAGCHGAGGNLGPAPPLRDAIFQAIVPKEELETILTKGRQNTLMPAFSNENGGTLTSTQIQVLVHEIKGIPYRIISTQDGNLSKTVVMADENGISPTWGLSSDPPRGVPPYWAPSTSANGGETGNVLAGAKVYARSCVTCHGDNGRGITKGNATIHTINDSVVLNLISDQGLRRYAITGRPDLGMPNFAEPRPGNPHFKVLTDQDVTDVVALLASWRQIRENDNRAQGSTDDK